MNYRGSPSIFQDNHLVGPSSEGPEKMSLVETEVSISMEDASFLLEKLYYERDDILQQNFLERMQPTLRRALGGVEDEKTEHYFQNLAVMNLAGHLNDFRPLHSTYVEAFSILGELFLNDRDIKLPSDDLEATIDLPYHLAQRLHSSVESVHRSKFQKSDTRIYPLLIAVVAHVVAQRSSDWLDIVCITKSMIQSSFYVDPDTVRAGLAVYGLQVWKRNHNFKGLTIISILDDLTQKW
jgi:hypothetical protein